MNPTADLQKQLVNYIVTHSSHDRRRPYIGLSGIADCEAVIYDRYVHGTPASIEEHMKSSISYDLEHALVEKLRKLRIYQPSEEIVLYNGLVQGHTDGRVGADLLEIKTIEREQWFPEHHLPFRIFYQVQAYLHYLQLGWAQVLYLARDTGVVRVYGLRWDNRKGEEIAQKLDRLVTAVTNMVRPECSCGRCEG
jgi:hypothetical protein